MKKKGKRTRASPRRSRTWTPSQANKAGERIVDIVLQLRDALEYLRDDAFEYVAEHAKNDRIRADFQQRGAFCSLLVKSLDGLFHEFLLLVDVEKESTALRRYRKQLKAEAEFPSIARRSRIR